MFKYMFEDYSFYFKCKCRNCYGRIADGQKAGPCPVCKRRYIGKYIDKKSTVIAFEIDENDNIIKTTNIFKKY